MKKSIILIAPLTLLISCTGTSEIFDDAYNDISAPPVEKVEENKGYADHIKSEEKNYPVEVEESSEGRTMDGLNPSYYGQNDYNEGDGHYHVSSQPNIQSGFYNGYGNYYNSPYGYSGNCNSWRVCQYSCMTWHNTGRCWHVNGNGYGNYYYNNGQYYNSGQYYDIVYGTNDPHAPYGWYGTGGSPYYGGYYNNYYGNYYCGGNYGGYYGNGSYYGNNWYNPYGNYGWGPYWGWNGLYFYNFNNSNNWNNNGNNNQDNETYSGNHHFGHRGGSNSGSTSQNNSNYEHTVHAPVQTNASPFPAFAAESELSASTEVSTKPLNTGTFESKPITSSGNQIVSDPAKPDFVNSNSTNETFGSFNGSKPDGNQNGIVTDNTVSKPVNGNNNFSGGSNTKPVTNSGTNVSKGKPANNQFAPTTVPNYSKTDRYNTNSGNNNTNYDNPNKYGTNNSNNGYKPDYSPSYGGGTTNSNNRRSNDGGTYNSGSSNRSGNSGSTYSGNRSSGSSSSTNSGSSGSSGKSSGTGGGTSRRN